LIIQNQKGDNLLNLMNLIILSETSRNINSYLFNKLITLEVHKRNYNNFTCIDLQDITHVDPETEKLAKELVTE